MSEFCCKRFEEEYKHGSIEEDTDYDTERPTGKYASTCCCGPGYAHICRDIEWCPWCGTYIHPDYEYNKRDELDQPQ